MSWAQDHGAAVGRRRAIGTCVAAAAALAEPFGAELACVHAPADVADLMPWMGEGFMGGVQATAVDAIREAARRAQGGRARSSRLRPTPRRASARWPRRSGRRWRWKAGSPTWWCSTTRRPRGAARWPRSSSRSSPTSSARRWWRARASRWAACVAVAWDGGKEASRAVRTALPLLEKASKVVILAAPAAAARQFDPAGLQGYFAARGVKSEIQTLEGAADAAPRLLEGRHRHRRQPAGRRRLRPPAAAGVHIRRRHADAS